MSKICTKCGIEKPRTEYYAHGTGRLGVKSHCKACCKADMEKFKKANPDKVKQYRQNSLSAAKEQPGKFNLALAVQNYKTADRFWELVSRKYTRVGWHYRLAKNENNG